MLEWKKLNQWKNKKIHLVLSVFFLIKLINKIIIFFLTYIFFVYNQSTFYVKDSGQIM